jgi:7 transmembrane sweet-taste receptor of 3 GCPR
VRIARISGHVQRDFSVYPPTVTNESSSSISRDNTTTTAVAPWDLAEIFYYPSVSTDFIFPNNESLLYGVFPRPTALPPDPKAGMFLRIKDTVFADGRSVPPDLLRTMPEQNYLSPAPRIFGLVLLGFTALSAVLAAVWVWVRVWIHRTHRIVRAAQAPFLYVICAGAIVSVSAIVPLSFDEGGSLPMSERQLSRCCMAIPWLASLGHIATYGTLFSKLGRIQLVLQFVRRKVDVLHVAWPSAVLVGMALVVLGLWTGLDPLKWDRHEINADTGENIAWCASEHQNAAAFYGPLV